MAFDQATADAVCDLLAEGPSLRKVCGEVGVKVPTFLLWVKERPELADHYARAREVGRSIRFERLRETTMEEPERDNYGKVDPGWVAWKKLAIDTEKWSLAREDAKKYGDRQHIEHSGKLGLESLIAGDEDKAT